MKGRLQKFMKGYANMSNLAGRPIAYWAEDDEDWRGPSTKKGQSCEDHYEYFAKKVPTEGCTEDKARRLGTVRMMNKTSRRLIKARQEAHSWENVTSKVHSHFEVFTSQDSSRGQHHG